MSDIWEFLLQTLTVSMVAALLLLLKRIFADKLPPRWQYHVWFLLALRILLPAATQNRYILLPLPVWIEALKTMTEQNLSSAFSAPYIPVYLTSGLPLPPLSQSMPSSITDWLFIIYVIGILLCLLRYIISYARLRLLLRSGQTVPADILLQVEKVCHTWNLKSCKIVMVEGLPSAFICGILRPVLALPAETKNGVLDEKILLHELLHLKQKDALQSVFWSLLRCLHWCNPFLQYVFDRIGNDMETLCDQRVLERLEGEERRAYGKILLGMTNDRYPRAFGTSSLSNGASNIARRITCIAHFKKYPKGMGLVSICIAVMLFSPLFVGVSTYTIDNSFNSPKGLATSLAAARLNRCTTVAGAIDTYAKGIINENGLYIAAASPFDKQEEIFAAMKAVGISEERNYSDTLDSGLNAWPKNSGDVYYVYNLRSSAVREDAFDTELVIVLADIARTQEDLEMYISQKGEDEAELLSSFSEQNGTSTYPGCAVYQLTVYYDQSGWVVEERAPHEKYFAGHLSDASAALSEYDCASFLKDSGSGYYAASGESGSVELVFYDCLTVNNSATATDVFWGSTEYFDDTARLDASFYWDLEGYTFTYTYSGPDENQRKTTEASIAFYPLEAADDSSALSETTCPETFGRDFTNGCDVSTHTFEVGEWDGILSSGSGGGSTLASNAADHFLQRLGYSGSVSALTHDIPAAFRACISLNGEEIEELILIPGVNSDAANYGGDSHDR